MQPPQSKSKIKRLLLILLVLMLLLVGYQAVQAARFRLVSSSPSLSSVPDIAPYIDLNFNKALSSKDAHIQMSPNVMKSFAVIGKAVRINLMATTDNIKYSVSISLRSTGGQAYSADLSFVPKNIAFDKLPESVRQAIINAQDPNSASLVSNNPLLAHLPYGGLGWRMTGIIGTNGGGPTLTIEVNVTFSDADYKSSPPQQKSLIRQREQEALNYIKSLGLNPSKYTFKYVTPSI